MGTNLTTVLVATNLYAQFLETLLDFLDVLDGSLSLLEVIHDCQETQQLDRSIRLCRPSAFVTVKTLDTGPRPQFMSSSHAPNACKSPHRSTLPGFVVLLTDDGHDTQTLGNARRLHQKPMQACIQLK